MAQIGDILEKERKRETDCDGRVIHLFQEGSFYRAYERSAWLCVKHVNPQMKVTRKALKGGGRGMKEKNVSRIKLHNYENKHQTTAETDTPPYGETID